MGWPKGRPRAKKNNFRTETEVNLEELLNGSTDTSMVEMAKQDDDETSDIMVVDKEGRYGVKTYKYGYELHVRRKFTKDTLVETQNAKTKESRQVLFKAGDFGPWEFAPKPYYSKLETLFTTLHQLMVKDTITENGTFDNLSKMIQESEQRIVRCLSAN